MATMLLAVVIWMMLTPSVDADAVGDVTRLTTDADDQTWADVDGDLVVYQDDRNGNFDIYLYNLSNGTETRLTTNTADQTRPRIHGDRVVYMDDRGTYTAIYHYHLTTGIKRSIYTSSYADQIFPDVYGDYVVWLDGRYGEWEIRYFDFNTGYSRVMRSHSSSYTYHRPFSGPVIDGDMVVYPEHYSRSYTTYDAHYYYLRVQKVGLNPWTQVGFDYHATYTTPAPTTHDLLQNPDIQGDTIVYVDRSAYSTTSNRIVIFDIETSTRTYLSGYTWHPDPHPTVYLDKVVWDYRETIASGTELRLYYISNATFDYLLRESDEQEHPRIYGDWVVFEDDRNGHEDLYLFFFDADLDGSGDSVDAYPFDPAASNDTDGDGHPDEWNPGMSADNSTSTPRLRLDAFPMDPAASLDSDNDGFPDGWNPGMTQANSTSDPKLIKDAFPQNPYEYVDTDGDGIGDNLDTDADDDGTPDHRDDFPLNETETTDTDRDGTGDNADIDDDNDGVNDTTDAFPKNPMEYLDHGR
jgi:beta propeller repeat protein